MSLLGQVVLIMPMTIGLICGKFIKSIRTAVPPEIDAYRWDREYHRQIYCNGTWDAQPGKKDFTNGRAFRKSQAPSNLFIFIAK